MDTDQKAKDGNNCANAYKPGPPLPNPFVVMRALSRLMGEYRYAPETYDIYLLNIGDLDNKVLDVDPEYQREVVWTGQCRQYRSDIMMR